MLFKDLKDKEFFIIYDETIIYQRIDKGLKHNAIKVSDGKELLFDEKLGIKIVTGV